MSEIISSIIKKNKPHFVKYKKYINDNNWTILKAIPREDGAPKVKYKSTVDLRLEEFTVQEGLIKVILERLKNFVKKSEGDHHLKIFKDFVKETLVIINTHIKRAEDYTTESDLSKIEDMDLRASEIAFHNILFKAVSSIEDAVSSLNIKEENQTDTIEFLDTQKATIAMHKDLVRLYPKIKVKLDELGIDFDSPPPQTIHILNENPPQYNPDKNYWEQDKETLQYYVDEYKKIDYGVTVGGYYFDGWLYFHFNHFVTKVPTTVMKGGILENEDVVKVPDLRDNEMLITEYFIKSKKDQLMSLVAATRRAAKTTMNGSRINRAQILGKKQILCAGGSSEDLGHIANNTDVCNENINPAFRLYYLSNTDDGRGKVYGIKAKNNKSKVVANTYIINLEGGTNKKKRESLAGFTPDEFILDEAMKFPFKSQLEALEPALWGVGVLRCSVIITGTGGDEDLAVDAIKMLNNPRENRITLMDWDSLERRVPEELRTWVKKDFGLFLPTQMCIKHVKIKSNLAEYLDIDSDELRKVDIWVTDWKTAKENEQKERDAKISDKKSYVRLLAYHPFDPSEIFLSGKENPFPVAEAKAHRDYLIKSGLWDRRRDLYKDTTGKIHVDISTQELAPFPFGGSNIDAPFLIFEDPPTEKVKWGTYCAGFDDYKHDSAEQASLASFYVWKNESIGDQFSKKIVASITFRPDRHPKVHEKWLLLMEAYQLEGTCFGENEDFTIKDFLDRRHLTEKYLATSLDFTQTFNLPNTLKRKFGWSPQSSKRTLFNLFVEYCNEDFTVENEDGTITALKGVQRIDDIWLLEEIIQYTENQNVDRMIGAMGGYGMVHYLISSHKWKVKAMKQENKEQEHKKPANRTKSFYSDSGRNRSFYRNR